MQILGFLTATLKGIWHSQLPSRGSVHPSFEVTDPLETLGKLLTLSDHQKAWDSWIHNITSKFKWTYRLPSKAPTPQRSPLLHTVHNDRPPNSICASVRYHFWYLIKGWYFLWYTTQRERFLAPLRIGYIARSNNRSEPKSLYSDNVVNLLCDFVQIPFFLLLDLICTLFPIISYSWWAVKSPSSPDILGHPGQPLTPFQNVVPSLAWQTMSYSGSPLLVPSPRDASKCYLTTPAPFSSEPFCKSSCWLWRKARPGLQCESHYYWGGLGQFPPLWKWENNTSWAYGALIQGTSHMIQVLFFLNFLFFPLSLPTILPPFLLLSLAFPFCKICKILEGIPLPHVCTLSYFFSWPARKFL